MKLLLLDQFSDPGGAQRGLLDLLPAVRQRGWQATIGMPGSGLVFEGVRALGFEAVEIACGPYASGRKSLGDAARFLVQTPGLARRIRELAQRAQADLVYLNGPRLLPAAARAGLTAPVLFHSHSHLRPGPVQRLAGSALRRLDGWVLAACRFVAAPWREAVRPERLVVVYNGVDGPGAPLFRPRKGAPRIGCIGRIAPEKGQREFLAVAARVRRYWPQCRFVVYGAALFSEPGVKQYAEEVRAAGGDAIEFPGWAGDVYAALADLDLVLVPSAAHEATTRVILEGFAAGIPVVAFRSGGIPEVIEDGRTGFLVDGVEEMARLAVDLLGDPARMSRISRDARESWSRNFTIERYREQVLHCMERAAGT